MVVSSSFSERMVGKGVLTKKNPVEIVIIDVLINKQPFFFPQATSFELHQIAMLHSTNQYHFIEEIVHALFTLADIKLLHSHHILIWKYTLQQSISSFPTSAAEYAVD